MAAGSSTYLKLLIGDTPVATACQKSTSFTINNELVDVSCKDNNGFRSMRPGLKSGSISVSGYIDWAAAATANPSVLAAGTLAGTRLKVEVSSTEASAFGLDGYAYCEEFTCTGDGIEQPVEYSATLQMDGAFTL